MLDVCLCFGCGGVGGEWVGGLDQDLEGWCYVCVSSEFSVAGAGGFDTICTVVCDSSTACICCVVWSRS